MSIALRLRLQPSRTLRALAAAYAVANGAAAALLGAGGRPWLAAALAAACLLAARAACRIGMARVIDLSGVGELRVAVQQGIGTAPPPAIPVVLLPGSTVWPHCLLLLLRPREGGAVLVLALAPDSVAPGQFRQLAVAIRTVARRDNKFFGNNKIL